MSIGLPCVSTFAAGGMLIDHGINGFLVKPNNAEELSEHINKLISDKSLILSFSKKA